VDHKDGETTTFATDRVFEHMGLHSMSDGARRVIRGLPRWAEALRSEIKKHRDLLTKLEEKLHKNDSRKKASHSSYSEGDHCPLRLSGLPAAHTFF